MQIGPLRCWPGGLCLSRSIGDMDVGEFIVPIPYVKQVKVYVAFAELKAYDKFFVNMKADIVFIGLKAIK